jgi:hypothetical protein
MAGRNYELGEKAPGAPSPPRESPDAFSDQSEGKRASGEAEAPQERGIAVSGGQSHAQSYYG